MIIITGANGQLGRGVVEQLLQRVPAEQIGVSVRDVEKAQELKDRGIRVRHGDFSDADSLAHAFEGASQVLIISSNSVGEEEVRQHRAAIDMAKKAGASRILYTSHMGSSQKSHFAPMVDHAATEELLKASGIDFTSLRNSFYATSALMFLGDALKTGELLAPEDGPVAWTAHADLAMATAIILSEHSLDEVTPNLTASEALDMNDIAAIASELVGLTIRRVVVSDEEYRTRMISSGIPEKNADMLMGIFYASRAGEFTSTGSTLAGLIGRPPMTMRDVLKASI